MKLKEILSRPYFVLTQFGIDPRRLFRSLRGMPRYIRDLLRFRATYTGQLKILPCLHDWYEEAGTTKSEYFWQDILVARMIFEAKPEKHVDIGSRMDGFIAHVASFRKIEVFDIRPMTTQIPGVTFKQVDIMKPGNGLQNYCDSVSCLHALEHFGLGRYGDSVDPQGMERGFANIANFLKKGGFLYLSIPIGIERVEFNAHRVSDPSIFIKLAESNSLQLSAFTSIGGGEVKHYSSSDAPLTELANQSYSLGIFTFVKECNG